MAGRNLGKQKRQAKSPIHILSKPGDGVVMEKEELGRPVLESWAPPLTWQDTILGGGLLSVEGGAINLSLKRTGVKTH